jgi:hypothetical protein
VYKFVSKSSVSCRLVRQCSYCPVSVRNVSSVFVKCLLTHLVTCQNGSKISLSINCEMLNQFLVSRHECFNGCDFPFTFYVYCTYPQLALTIHAKQLNCSLFPEHKLSKTSVQFKVVDSSIYLLDYCFYVAFLPSSFSTERI